MRGNRRLLVSGLLAIWAATPALAEGPPLAETFRYEIERVARQPLAGLPGAAEWKERRPELQRQLREMMGLEPAPEKTDLKVEVRGTLERSDFVVEKILFQSRPGLFVTGNLYRPKQPEGRLPAILYVCGHAKVEKDGVIYGNKAHYQHHGAWFAANGYVCLILDTLQLGELGGLHHGTYREGMWWWQGRGYTPAGVEAWNGIRAIDYLVSRPDVDPERIGVTGRSGGGATSWWLGALDDRVKAVVPVAGITDLRDHVVEVGIDGKYDMGVVEGHCDCMYYLNTYRWDFETLAALCAPKALLFENTDHDPIFPEDGVRRIYANMERVWGWYGAREKLTIQIGTGGHVDSPELRHAAFAFFERWLKGKDPRAIAIQEPDRKIPEADLKVLSPGETPEGNRNPTVQDWFVARAEPIPAPKSAEDWEKQKAALLERVRTLTFGGWPERSETPPILVPPPRRITHDGIEVTMWELGLFPGIEAPNWAFRPVSGSGGQPETIVHVADQVDWKEKWRPLQGVLERGDERALAANETWQSIRKSVQGGASVSMVAPRGIGPSAWDPKRDVHVRRRFALLGQTLDGMRAWDVKRLLDAIRDVEKDGSERLTLIGARDAATWVLWAAAFTPDVDAVRLIDPPTSVHAGPAYLNLERILDMPQAVALLAPRKVELDTPEPDAWKWGMNAATADGEAWLRILPTDVAR